MGYNIDKFLSPVDEEFICPICGGVFENPIQISGCEHAFCVDCILKWLDQSLTCPVDRKNILLSDLKSAPRILKNLLSKLTISCDYKSDGCNETIKLELLKKHLKECDYNPKKVLSCKFECGYIATKNLLQKHNCDRDLHTTLLIQIRNVFELEHKIKAHKLVMNNSKSETTNLEESVKKSIFKNRVKQYYLLIKEEHNMIVQWSNTLHKVQVNRWDRIIPTPCNYLQNIIEDSLRKSGCPLNIINDLITNSHECNWPVALSSVENRMHYCEEYKKYICRRIPIHPPYIQAVVVLHVDKPYLDNTIMKKPGLIFMFV